MNAVSTNDHYSQSDDHPSGDNRLTPDWDPTSPEVQRDQLAAYDEMRRRCPVAYSEFMGWSLFRHEDVTRALFDHETFSSAVSQHLSVPSGMDQPEHTAYRRIIEPYFAARKMEWFEPICREIARALFDKFIVQQASEFMIEAALPFAGQAQCSFLSWPPALTERLIGWTRKNHEATLARDRKAMSAIAVEFEEIIDGILESRFEEKPASNTDITYALMREKVWNRPLSNEEIASILRNWTVGEIGTISAAIGILANYMATHEDLQKELRERPALLSSAIDEILRIQGPLVANRRVTTRPVEIGGRRIGTGERITLMWMAANRDEAVFEQPGTFRLDRDPSKNLLYGAGIHVCPGASLARLELRVFMEELLANTTGIKAAPNSQPIKAVYPASGFAVLPLQLLS
jgi:cytochrome P450